MPRTFTRRDVLLLAVGAGVMRIFSWSWSPEPTATLVWNATELEEPAAAHNVPDLILDLPVPPSAQEPAPALDLEHVPAPSSPQEQQTTLKTITLSSESGAREVYAADTLPSTRVLSHAPGWTVFEDIYMSNGTLFIVSDEPASSFPDVYYMTSTGLPGAATEESVRERIPGAEQMQVISVADAHARWGKGLTERNRVWTVQGDTFLFNDPSQFLQHYYHFCAELLFGAWGFWSGTFSNNNDRQNLEIPIPSRAIFAHADAAGWRDRPGFNPYFLRAAFPGLAVETVDDWEDRIAASVPPSPLIGSPHYADHGSAPPPERMHTSIYGLRGAELHRESNKLERAWHFPRLLLADRSAAFRGVRCGAQNQRTASEAIEAMREMGRLAEGSGRAWWEGVRRNVLSFAGVRSDAVGYGMVDDREAENEAPIVITYISRQGSRRRLLAESHEVLVSELQALVDRKNAEVLTAGGRKWELSVIQAERMSKDEQVQAAGRTTVMLGVHGNGLTHLILMPPSPLSAVIEMFYPGGQAHDYEWTSSEGLKMAYYAVWNDTSMPSPETHKLTAAYPEGFHGTEIPVDGTAVSKLIEEHIDRALVASSTSGSHKHTLPRPHTRDLNTD